MTLWLSLFLSLWALPAGAGPVPCTSVAADAIVGVWTDEDHTMRVEVYACGDAYCGRLVWLAEAQEKDTAPVGRHDLSLRSRLLLGMEILTGLRYLGDGTWDGGRMYAPQRGRTVDVSFTQVNDVTLKVKASRFVFRKTVLWTRVPS